MSALKGADSGKSDLVLQHTAASALGVRGTWWGNEDQYLS